MSFVDLHRLAVEQVAEVPKPEVTLNQLPSLFTSDQSGRTRLLEVSWWWDQERTMGHVIGAITRKDEMLLFDPQKYQGGETTPIYDFTDFNQYCASKKIERVHYMILDQWVQSETLGVAPVIKTEAP